MPTRKSVANNNGVRRVLLTRNKNAGTEVDNTHVTLLQSVLNVEIQMGCVGVDPQGNNAELRRMYSRQSLIIES